MPQEPSGDYSTSVQSMAWRHQAKKTTWADVEEFYDVI